MDDPWANRSAAARARKALVVCAVVLLVAGGLCGLQFVAFASGAVASGPLTGVLMTTGVIELVAMGGAALAGFLTLLLWLIRSLPDRRK